MSGTASEGFLRDQKIRALAGASPGRCGCGHAWSVHHVDGCSDKNGHDVYCGCGVVPPLVVEFLREERRSVLLGACRAHPRYQIRRRPARSCEACWRMYIALNPKVTS